jgi:serine/threonine protein kinase
MVSQLEQSEYDLPLGTRVLDRYVLLGKLTQGGMAEVYLAQQRGAGEFQKLCVIKRVRPHLAQDKDFVAMFTNEARLAAKISHPNVVQIFDLGQGGPSGNDWFLTMEYLDGRDMLQIGRACRAHNKAVPFDVTARIIADACAGLDFAHRLTGDQGEHLNLVHRDMSPENLVITFDGQVKVVDFGIAKAKDNAFRTQAGQIKGKLGYVAPEAILGQALDARADIFAIGATLYLFLCGRPAFTGTNPMEVFERSLQPPTPPSEVNTRVPLPLDQICMRCLAQDPDQRYQTAGDLRSALETYLQGTGRPLGRPQLAQFMRILFPPGRDPQRQRVDGLIREGQAIALASMEGEPVSDYVDGDATVARAPEGATEAQAAPVSVTQAPAEVSGLVPQAVSVEATAITPSAAPPPFDVTDQGPPEPEDRTREVDTTLLRELSSVLDDSFEPTPPPLGTDPEMTAAGWSPDDADDIDISFEEDDVDIDFDDSDATVEANTLAHAAPPPALPSEPPSDALETMRREPLGPSGAAPVGTVEPSYEPSFTDPSLPPPLDMPDVELQPIGAEASLTPAGVSATELDVQPPELQPVTAQISPPPPPHSTDVSSQLTVQSAPPAASGPSGAMKGVAFLGGATVGGAVLGGVLYVLGWLQPTLAFFGL